MVVVVVVRWSWWRTKKKEDEINSLYKEKKCRSLSSAEELNLLILGGQQKVTVLIINISN